MRTRYAGLIVSDRWREPTSQVGYVATGKEIPEVGWDFEGKKYAYWMFAERIKDKFGDEPVTVYEIYRKITGPLGLTSSDTITLVRGAKKEGYLK